MTRLMMTHIAALMTATAFANPGWKLDADGKIEMKDGNPIWVDANGGESTLDGGVITRLNGEAATLRKRAETAETKAKAFEGLDPDTAKKAIETVGKIDAKKLIDAGEVDKVRAEIAATFTTQIGEKDKVIGDLQSRYDNLQIDNVFAGSDFIRDRVAIPRDMFEASLRGNFKMEDGKIVAKDKSGNPVYSKTNPGQYADPQEAIQILTELHPQKDLILKADSGNGTGGNGGGGNRGNSRTISRADFDKLDPVRQNDVAGKAQLGEMQIVD